MRKKVTTPKKKGPVKASRFRVLLADIDALEIERVYKSLKAKLQIDVKRMGDSVLRRLLLEAPEDQRLAGWLYAVAKEELARVQLRFEHKMGRWVPDARARISELKADGDWDGTVTQGDVERVISRAFTEYRTEREKVITAEKIERAARTLNEVFEGRLSSLQSYARLAQKHAGISRYEFNEAAKPRGEDDDA
jgi:hypothetical protein